MLEPPKRPEPWRSPPGVPREFLGFRPTPVGLWLPHTPGAHGFMWGLIGGAGLEALIGGGTGIGLWIAMPLIGILIAKIYTRR